MASINFEWYQNDSSVTVDVFAKGIRPESIRVEFRANEVEVKLELTSGATFEKKFVLADRIQASECTYRVSAYKLELSLRKAAPGQWKTLEHADAQPVDQPIAREYPSSSRTKHKWEEVDKVVATTDAEEEPQTPDEFFRKLYAGASDETRRAMMKSFIESGGTVLSTNWNEVGSKKVEPAPPEGVKYEKK